MTTTEPPHEWIFTFGSGQRLRSTSSSGRIGVTSTDAFATLPLGLPLHNRYVAIRAETHPEARALMVAVFGDLWSMEYSSRHRAGVDEYGLIELDISEALAELAKERPVVEAEVYPADWPPRPGDIWMDKRGLNWACQHPACFGAWGGADRSLSRLPRTTWGRPCRRDPPAPWADASDLSA